MKKYCLITQINKTDKFYLFIKGKRLEKQVKAIDEQREKQRKAIKDHGEWLHLMNIIENIILISMLSLIGKKANYFWKILLFNAIYDKRIKKH